MKKMDLILCGLGGQGILFITKILSLTAMEKGYNILAAETHGMAQRGGSVISHLRFGKVNSSLINIKNADIIISLEENEAYRNITFLKKGGKIYTNINAPFNPTKKIKQYFYEENIECHTIKANKIVQKLSAPLSLNLAVLGYFLSFDNNLFTKEDVKKTVEKISPKRFKSNNLEIFETCSENIII